MGAKNAGFEVAVASQQNSHIYEALLKHNIKFIEVKHLQRHRSDIGASTGMGTLQDNQKRKARYFAPKQLESRGIGRRDRKIGRRAKIIFTAHGWAFNDPRPPLQLKIITFISRFAARFQDKIICVSEYDRQKR